MVHSGRSNERLRDSKHPVHTDATYYRAMKAVMNYSRYVIRRCFVINNFGTEVESASLMLDINTRVNNIVRGVVPMFSMKIYGYPKHVPSQPKVSSNRNFITLPYDKNL